MAVAAQATLDLFAAASVHPSGHIEALLTAGADVDALDEQGRSCLLIACRRNCHEDVALYLIGKISEARLIAERDACLVTACKRGWAAVVQRLLSLGAHPNASIRSGWTALHAASAQGHLAVVHELLKAGADINAVSGSGETPLSLACLYVRRDDVAIALLEAGADVMLVDRKAFFNACFRGDIFMRFIRAVLKMDKFPNEVLLAPFQSGTTPLHQAAPSKDGELFDLLLKHGASVNARDEEGATPLMRTVSWCASLGDSCLGQRERLAVETLLDAGAEIDAQCERKGRTALHVALATETTCPALIMRLKNGCADLLLERGASVHTRDNYGWTPLHTACRLHLPRRVTQLLDCGASITAETDGGLTPLATVCQGFVRKTMRDGDDFCGEHVVVARILLGRGADFGSAFPGSDLTVGDGPDVAGFLHGDGGFKGEPTEKAACQVLLKAWAPKSQPLAAPLALRWVMARLTEHKDWTVRELSPGAWDGLTDPTERLALRELKLAPLGDDAWERRKHLVVCRALVKARRQKQMMQADGGGTGMASSTGADTASAAGIGAVNGK